VNWWGGSIAQRSKWHSKNISSVCHPGCMGPCQGVRMSIEASSKETALRGSQEKIITPARPSLLKGRRVPQNWPLMHLFCLSPYTQVAESSGERRLTFSTRNVFHPQTVRNKGEKQCRSYTLPASPSTMEAVPLLTPA
jgi:hypothetical protein